MPYVKSRVYRDYKRTGKCRYSLGDLVGGYGFMAIGLKKNSPYTNAISMG